MILWFSSHCQATKARVTLLRSHEQSIVVAEDPGEKLEIWSRWIHQHGP